MANQSDIVETLFSFEFLVEYIRINQIGEEKKNLKPAVGVRLLDFPTLVIYQRDCDDVLLQGDSDSEKENISSSDLLLQPRFVCFEYSFNRGKSCLFKIHHDLLHMHLSNTPLYAMVLDLRDKVPKLVGSSLISLAKLTDKIIMDVKEHGICTPSTHGEKGIFPICNLMGEKIGNMSLAYKLLSLGASLIQHITKSRIYKVGSTQDNSEQAGGVPDSTKGNGGKDIKGSSQPRLDCHSEHFQKVELEEQQTKVMVSDPEPHTGRFTSTGTQTEYARKQAEGIKVNQTAFDIEINPDIFCPPPLYYRCPEKKLECEENRCRLINAEMDGLRIGDLCSEDDRYEGSNEVPEYGQSVMHYADGPRNPRGAQQTPVAPTVLGEALRQLPLLNALLAELSQLNGQSQQQPFSVHPNLAWLYRPAAEERSVSEVRAASISPVRRPSPTPRTKRSGLPANSATQLATFPTEKAKTKRQERTHPKSDPRRKLTYGLTNTLRLRLQQTNPKVLREHQQKERCRKMQEDLLKNKSNKNVCHSQVNFERGQQKKAVATKREVLNRSARLDEHIQTLVSNVMMKDSPLLQPGGDQESSRVAERNSGETQFSFPRPLYGDAPSQRMKRSHHRMDRNIAIRIPSALSQYSHQSESEGVEGDAGDPVVRSASVDEHRSTLSLVQRHPDSHGNSPELVEYPDDFTSLEATEGHSLDFLSSPEPVLGSASRQGIEDGFSSGSASYNDGRAVLPIPIKAGASPKRALKGTHVVTHRAGASAAAASSDDSESGPSSAYPVQGRPHRGYRAQGNTAEGPSSSSDLSQRSDPPADPQSVQRSTENHATTDSESILTLDPSEDEEAGDELGSLEFKNKYYHVSELVANKLPGYTL